MKNRFLSFFMVIVFLMLFTSCSAKSTSGSGQDYIISSIGFDNNEGKLAICLEAIIINSEDSSANKNVKLIYGKGNNAKEAFAQAEMQTVQSLTLSHCTTVAIGNSVTEKQLNDIYDFLYNTDRFSLSMILVSCDKAFELLGCTPNSSIAIGYDILSYLERLEKRTGTVLLNKLYNISAMKENPLIITSLPYLSVENNEFSYSGLVVYQENRKPLNLSQDNALIFLIINSHQKNGSFILNQSLYTTSGILCKPDFSKLEDNQIGLTITIRHKQNIEDEIKTNILQLFSIAKQSNIDIFGFYNKLFYTNRKIFNQKKDEILNLNYKLNINIVYKEE